VRKASGQKHNEEDKKCTLTYDNGTASQDLNASRANKNPGMIISNYFPVVYTVPTDSKGKATHICKNNCIDGKGLMYHTISCEITT
jgi:hypothetical protein